MGFLIALIIIGLIFDFMNGYNDSANIVATMITSRAMTMRSALILASIAELIGPFIFGTAVATTIGSSIVNPSCIDIKVIFAAISGAIVWSFITMTFGVPSSSSHGLIGGILGAVIASSGFSNIKIEGVLKVVTVLFASPIIGFLSCYIFSKLLFRFSEMTTPRINSIFKILQIPSSTLLALGSGANDSQKAMGIITMGLVILGFQQRFAVPFWVILVCALALAFGIASGGLKVIKTVGAGIFRIRPIHGFAVQTCSAFVMLTAALIGGPVSTSHVVSSAVVGAGASENKAKVRWSVVTDILLSWLITMPVTAIMAGIIYKVIVVL